MVKYSFNPKELNNWKARITERLIECYIKEVLIPKMKKEGWNHVFLIRQGWFNPPNLPKEFKEIAETLEIDFSLQTVVPD